MRMTCRAVIPAKAGIHLDPVAKANLDSGFRRNDEPEQ
jgi:hypothetical protein